jgi:hypothetical protein
METALISPGAGHHAAFVAVLLLTLAWLFAALHVPQRAMTALLGWQALMGGLALAGYFMRFDQPWRVLPTVGLSMATALWLASRPWPTAVGRWLAASPPWAWAALQTFRLPLEWLLHSLFVHGVIGRQMTFAGYNFDILVGLSAPVMAVLLYRSGERRWVQRLAVAWNLLGLALLVNIVVIAVLSIPFAFQLFTTGPANRLVASLPFIWLPTLLVPVALCAHLCALRLLLQPSYSRPSPTLETSP